MAYKLTGLVCAPGGFGTLDELFELLTLKQTGKIKRPIPVVLFGKTYWSQVLNLQKMADFGMISQVGKYGGFCRSTRFFYFSSYARTKPTRGGGHCPSRTE